MTRRTDTPRSSSRPRFPAEWEPHRRCWIAWPCRPETWGPELASARNATAAVARAIAPFEPVRLLHRPEDVGSLPPGLPAAIETRSMAMDDSWLRDTGPTFRLTADGTVEAVCWRFNGWGGIYQPYALDAEMGRRIAAWTGTPGVTVDLVMEGGAIHTDGQGTILTTAECLLHPSRNPGLTQPEIERRILGALGADSMIWLPAGLIDDETAGHVDEIAMFADAGTIVLAGGGGRTDPNRARVDACRRALGDARTAAGDPWRLVEAPTPRPRHHPDGRRITQSYVNCYLAGDGARAGVILPAFDDPADDEAAALFAELFPDRRIVPVPAAAITRGGGGIHCITQQEPRPVPLDGRRTVDRD